MINTSLIGHFNTFIGRDVKLKKIKEKKQTGQMREIISLLKNTTEWKAAKEIKETGRELKKRGGLLFSLFGVNSLSGIGFVGPAETLYRLRQIKKGKSIVPFTVRPIDGNMAMAYNSSKNRLTAPDKKEESTKRKLLKYGLLTGAIALGLFATNNYLKDNPISPHLASSQLTSALYGLSLATVPLKNKSRKKWSTKKKLLAIGGIAAIVGTGAFLLSDWPDQDGLRTLEELTKYNTSPLSKNTDDDIFSDSEEIELGFNPNNPQENVFSPMKDVSPILSQIGKMGDYKDGYHTVLSQEQIQNFERISQSYSKEDTHNLTRRTILDAGYLNAGSDVVNWFLDQVQEYKAEYGKEGPTGFIPCGSIGVYLDLAESIPEARQLLEDYLHTGFSTALANGMFFLGGIEPAKKNTSINLINLNNPEHVQELKKFAHGEPSIIERNYTPEERDFYRGGASFFLEKHGPKLETMGDLALTVVPLTTAGDSNDQFGNYTGEQGAEIIVDKIPFFGFTDKDRTDRAGKQTLHFGLETMKDMWSIIPDDAKINFENEELIRPYTEVVKNLQNFLRATYGEDQITHGMEVNSALYKKLFASAGLPGYTFKFEFTDGTNYSVVGVDGKFGLTNNIFIFSPDKEYSHDFTEFNYQFGWQDGVGYVKVYLPHFWNTGELFKTVY